jgi:hypothetical protein
MDRPYIAPRLVDLGIPMERRDFFKRATFAGAGLFLPFSPARTRHLILIVPSGARKSDYYEQRFLSPNIYGLAREGFVFEEDHCERVASHDAAFTELLQGREFKAGASRFPTILDYIGNGVQTDSIRKLPQIMQQYTPRVVICRERTHDAGHDGYEKYLSAVASTDRSVGTILDWLSSHPYFSGNTAIVIRPDFGRDDLVNEYGQLHHSYGFYSTHRVASIFWGPDFNRGVDRETVIRALDMAPTLTKLFGVDATHAQGRILPGLFRD